LSSILEIRGVRDALRRIRQHSKPASLVDATKDGVLRRELGNFFDFRALVMVGTAGFEPTTSTV
jgi:hypothetical protein